MCSPLRRGCLRHYTPPPLRSHYPVIRVVIRLKTMRERLGCWLTFVGVLLAFAIVLIGTILLLRYSALLYFSLLISLFFGSILLNTLSNHRLFRLIGSDGYGDFPIDESHEYVGIYRPHWEIGHIAVPYAKRTYRLFPVFERWCPRLEPPDYVDVLPDGRGPFIIRFVGRVSERGSYGHMGSACRKVVVERVLESRHVKTGG